MSEPDAGVSTWGAGVGVKVASKRWVSPRVLRIPGLTQMTLRALAMLNARIINIYIVLFLGGAMVKNTPVNAGDVGSIPGWGRSPGEGNGSPLQYSGLKNPWTEVPGGLQPMGSRKSRT